jgi:hypothetical protein
MKTNATIPIATKANVRLSCAKRICMGVGSDSTEVSERAIFPSSVFIPVAITTASARPRTTIVPMNARFVRSPSARLASESAATVLSTAIDSPVNADSSIAKSVVWINRQSAGTK